MSEQGSVIIENVGFIGGGNMAKAICVGMINKGLIKYNQVYVSGPRIQNLNSWKDSGANISDQNGFVTDNASIVFLTVKPHILNDAISNALSTGKQSQKRKLFISVIAGVPIVTLRNCLKPFDNFGIIRVMPNTPMLVGAGCSVFSIGPGATDSDKSCAIKMLQAAGLCREVPENLIDAVGAVSGSGPAFIYLMIEALSDGGVKMGVPRALSTELAAQTVLGAAKMVQDTGKHTGVLKDEVCSPGGTTIEGIHALEKGGVRAAIMDAIEAATNKAKLLGQKV